MHRRLLLCALACWPGARLLAQDEEPRPRQKISAAQLHKALSARFPLRLGLPGLLDLQFTAPRLLLLPTRNQLGASVLAQASGQALHRTRTGEVDLAFGLRYEASARTVRNMQWFEVTETRGHIRDGKVAHWQVTVKVGFTLE